MLDGADSVSEDVFQALPFKLAARLAVVSRGGGRRCGHRAGSREGLYLSHDFLAAAVGIKDLGEEGPEGILLAE